MGEAPKDRPGGDGAAAGDGQGALDEPTPGKKTRYMVLWSRVPQEDDHEYRWIEIGWYPANSMDVAKRAGARDQESGQYGRIVDAAKQGPIKVRAVAASSWPDVESSGVETPPPELVIR